VAQGFAAISPDGAPPVNKNADKVEPVLMQCTQEFTGHPANPVNELADY